MAERALPLHQLAADGILRLQACRPWRYHVDDHFKNLDFFEERTLLFSQPHNKNADNRGHERVESWRQIAERLL